MRTIFAILAVHLLATPVLAQDTGGFFDRLFGTDEAETDEEQGGLLEGFLEDNLSGEGRQVSVEGFRGALSGRATLDSLEISDEQGVWLTLTDVVLDWNRSALFRGRLEVTELSAAEILLPRRPVAAEEGEAPVPEASGFSLPELPVSVAIDSINAERVAIGQPVFGTEAEVSVEGSLQLDGGEGAALLDLNKLDGSGAIRLDAAYSNQDEVLSLDLTVSEEADGIVAGLLDLPGRPAVDFSITGEAPISDYRADIRLATDGVERLSGSIQTTTPENPEDGALRILADISGDIAPIFNPAYQPFFGPDVRLAARATTFADGSLDIDEIELSAASIRLNGTVRVGPDGVPREIDIAGDIASDTGAVVLPLPGPETLVQRVDLDVEFDAAVSELWSGNFLVTGLQRDGVSAERLALTGSGSISSGDPASVSATLDFEARALDLGDPEASEAVGEVVSGRARIDWASGGPINLTDLEIDGESYGLEGAAELAFGDNGPAISGDIAVRAERLSAFSGIASRPLGGSVALQSSFSVEPLAGFFDISAEGSSQSLVVSQPQVDRILEGEARLDFSVARDESGIAAVLRSLESPNARLTGEAVLKSGGSNVALEGMLQDAAIVFPNAQGPLRLNARATEDQDRVWTWRAATSFDGFDLFAEGTAVDIFATPVITTAGQVSVARLSDFSYLLDRPISGAVSADFAGEATLDLERVSGNLSGTAQDVKTGIPQVDALLEGEVDFDLDGARAGQVITLRDSNLEGAWIALRADGTLVPDAGRFEITGRLPDASRVLEQAPDGPLEFSIEGTQDGRDWTFAASALGAGLSVSAEGIALDPLGSTPAVDGQLRASAEDLSVLSELAGRSLAGRLEVTANGNLNRDLSRFDVDAEARGSGIRLGQSEIDRLLAGDLSLGIQASREGDAIDVANFDLRTGSLTATAVGSLARGDSRLAIEARLADIGPFAPGFSGPVSLNGDVSQGENGYTVDLQASGPGGANVTTTGTIATDFGNAALEIDGSGPLGLLDTFIKPRSISGTAGWDLALNGPLSLQSLSGTVSVSGARFIAPTLGIVLNDISANARLSNGQAQLALTSSVDNGGALSVNGPVSLTPPFNADLDVALNDVVLRDPRLYETSIRGNVSIDGPLSGGARIAGDLTLGETNIRIPSSGLGGAGAVPEIIHLNEPPPVRGTRRKAGLLDSGDAGAGTSGPRYPLDIRVTAPNRLFVRGRGLESEFSGALRITGTTRNVVPSGGFNLVRGRLDILGQRLALEEATVTIQGSFVPTVRIRATTRADEYTIVVLVAGPVTDPEITFTSEPDLPQEEVLARLIFGRGLDTLSPLQAARLALAVRTLAGRGGEGVVGNIRQGAGLADLDVTTDEEGNAEVTAGAYLGENLYTDVTVGADGETELNLNLDLTDSVTVKGSVTNEGDSSIGIFFERDY